MLDILDFILVIVFKYGPGLLLVVGTGLAMWGAILCMQSPARCPVLWAVVARRVSGEVPLQMGSSELTS